MMIELITLIMLIKLLKKLKQNKNFTGILVCGSGMGMNITANRHKNIRAAAMF